MPWGKLRYSEGLYRSLFCHLIDRSPSFYIPGPILTGRRGSKDHGIKEALTECFYVLSSLTVGLENSLAHIRDTEAGFRSFISFQMWNNFAAGVF